MHDKLHACTLRNNHLQTLRPTPKLLKPFGTLIRKLIGAYTIRWPTQLVLSSACLSRQGMGFPGCWLEACCLDLVVIHYDVCTTRNMPRNQHRLKPEYSITAES